VCVCVFVFLFLGPHPIWIHASFFAHGHAVTHRFIRQIAIDCISCAIVHVFTHVILPALTRKKELERMSVWRKWECATFLIWVEKAGKKWKARCVYQWSSLISSSAAASKMSGPLLYSSSSLSLSESDVMANWSDVSSSYNLFLLLFCNAFFFQIKKNFFLSKIHKSEVHTRAFYVVTFTVSSLSSSSPRFV